MTYCFLSLGSNMGDRLSNIKKAIFKINQSDNNKVILESPIYESDAMYNEGLDRFYNCVIKIKTTLTAFDLLEFAKNIEKQLGRNISDQRYSPRLIDIDILSYGQHIIDSEKLKVPHPSIGERKFVLKPWVDLDYNYILANSRKKIFDLLNELSDNTKLTFIE